MATVSHPTMDHDTILTKPPRSASPDETGWMVLTDPDHDHTCLPNNHPP